MNLFRDIGYAAWAWRGALTGLPHLSLWGPLLLVTAVQAVSCLLLVFFYHPAVEGFAPTIVEALGGEAATHYPQHLFVLPALFRPIHQGIAALLLSLAVGAATIRFADHFGHHARPHSAPNVFVLAIKLIVVMLALVEIDEATRSLFSLIPESIRLRSSVIRLGLAGTQLLVVVLVQTLLAFTTAWIVLRGHSIPAAVRDSVRVAKSAPVTTFLLVVVRAGLLFPFSFFLLEMDVAEKGILPEWVAWILGSQLLVELLLNFLTVGAITFVFIQATGNRR